MLIHSVTMQVTVVMSKDESFTQMIHSNTTDSFTLCVAQRLKHFKPWFRLQHFDDGVKLDIVTGILCLKCKLLNFNFLCIPLL